MRFLLAAENKKRLSGGRDYWAEGKNEKEVEKLGIRDRTSSILSDEGTVVCHEMCAIFPYKYFDM